MLLVPALFALACEAEDVELRITLLYCWFGPACWMLVGAADVVAERPPVFVWVVLPTGITVDIVSPWF